MKHTKKFLWRVGKELACFFAMALFFGALLLVDLLANIWDLI